MENGKKMEPHHNTLKQFKKNVADILQPNDTDPYLMKWLKSKSYDVKKAETIFREMHAFRKYYSLDTLCDNYTKPEIAERYEYTAFLGYAKDGSIVRYSALGKGDHYGFIASMSPYQLGHYGAHIMEEDLERQRRRSELTGENVTEITYIFDLGGLSLQDILHKCVYELGLDLGFLVQEYYPEIWGHLFFINVPPYFDTMYNMFKPIMRMSVIQKIQVVSRENVGHILLKYVDEDVLPVFLGGKRIDSRGDPKCSEFLRFGGRVPEKYHVQQRSTLLQPQSPGVREVWVRRVFDHPVVVKRANTTIKVELRTEGGSIHMCIYYRRENGEELRKISPGLRVQTHISPIDDFNIAHEPGTYIYRFNNSHSWFGSRRLIFRINPLDQDSS